MSTTTRATTIGNVIGYDFVRVDARSQTRDRFTYNLTKRTVDFLGSAIGILLLSPLMLAVALLVRLTSPGPIVFRQRRLGVGGREFWCYKFRTMVVDAEERLRRDQALRAQFDTNYKLKNDPR